MYLSNKRGHWSWPGCPESVSLLSIVEGGTNSREPGAEVGVFAFFSVNLASAKAIVSFAAACIPLAR